MQFHDKDWIVKSKVYRPESVSMSPAISSPRNNRLARVLRYQAFGNARISVNLLMSYLKEADPISQIAETNNIFAFFVLQY